MAENATKCSAADGLTQTFDFGHGTPLMVRAVDFNALHAECQKLRKDAERLDWLRDNLFEHKWNGVVGVGCAVQWHVAPDFRFKQRELSDDSGIMAGDFRRAIDAAMEKPAGSGAA